MNDIHDDGCDPLLTPRPAAEAPALKQLILHQTTGVLRRRRVTRRVLLGVALAACYAAGVLTPQLWPSAAPTTNDRVAKLANADQQHSGEPPASQPVPPNKDEPPTEPADLPPPALERSVTLVSPEQRAALYRQAGDRYLEEANDVASALRCYRRSLDESADADLTISPDDNWLLMAVKNARMEERRHALANE
jgi:hypothetical protein